MSVQRTLTTMALELRAFASALLMAGTFAGTGLAIAALLIMTTIGAA